MKIFKGSVKMKVEIIGIKRFYFSKQFVLLKAEKIYVFGKEASIAMLGNTLFIDKFNVVVSTR